jgi:hemerythrin
MAIIEWSDSYSLGIFDVDSQHKKLVTLVNDLHSAMKNGQSKEIIGNIIGALIAYTRVHFSTEEKLLEQFSYENTNEHKMEHQNFVNQVADFKHKFDNNELGLSIQVMNFLSDWIIKHINGSDTKYVPFLKSQGVR